MMLPNGLASDDDAKAFKYDAASNGLPYHMNVDSYSRTPGSRQPSPSEEDLTKNHSPGISHSVPIKPGDSIGMPPNNPHSAMSLTGPIQAPGLSNGIGPMSGLVNGGGGPPGKLIIYFLFVCV